MRDNATELLVIFMCFFLFVCLFNTMFDFDSGVKSDFSHQILFKQPSLKLDRYLDIKSVSPSVVFLNFTHYG